MDASGTDIWSFHCSACGKCCNSPPQLSVPELFHHQHRFIGCLAIRRVFRPGGTEIDTRAFSELADALLHRLPDSAGGGNVQLVTQAHAVTMADEERCPALGDDMRCEIHDTGKPAACSVVPFDALVPDRMQHLVLSERRREASYLGADCIVPGTRPGFARVTRRLAVVDPTFADALARRRRDLLIDRRMWGDAVFRMLLPDLFHNPAALARVPPGGFLVMDLAPVLIVLAQASARSRARCLAYLEAQAALIEDRLGTLPGSAQAHAFLETNRLLQGAFERTPAPLGRAEDIEAWMGLGSAIGG
jgi:Fe-S-cluster containining protein